LKDLITNHFNDTPKYEYISNIYIKQQKLSPAEEKALINHIINYYKSILPLNIKLFYYYANELYRAKEDNKPVGKN